MEVILYNQDSEDTVVLHGPKKERRECLCVVPGSSLDLDFGLSELLCRWVSLEDKGGRDDWYQNHAKLCANNSEFTDAFGHRLRWMTSLVAQRVKRLPSMLESWVRSLGQQDTLRRKWQPTPVFLPGESHGQRSPAGYSPWTHKELDMTKATWHTACMRLRAASGTRGWLIPYHLLRLCCKVSGAWCWLSWGQVSITHVQRGSRLSHRPQQKNLCWGLHLAPVVFHAHPWTSH